MGKQFGENMVLTFKSFKMLQMCLSGGLVPKFKIKETQIDFQSTLVRS